MAKVEFLKTAQGLVYASDDDKDKMSRIGKLGSVIHGNFSAPRNSQFHRKCRVLQDTIFDNQDMFEDKEAFREWLKLKTGLYVWMVDPHGKKYPKTLSTSYEKMDEIEHSKWYSRLIDFAIQDSCLFEGKTKEEANMLVDQILGGFAG